MTPNRKRGRCAQEDETEFTPLSKRINNLHINPSWLLESQVNTPISNITNGAWGSAPPFLPPPATTSLPDSPPLSVQSSDWNPSISASYNPELTERENPYYYNSNKLLYEMYVARSQRNND